MDTERDAFVSSLAKFTYLTTIKAGPSKAEQLSEPRSFSPGTGNEAKEHRVHQGEMLEGTKPLTMWALPCV